MRFFNNLPNVCLIFHRVKSVLLFQFLHEDLAMYWTLHVFVGMEFVYMVPWKLFDW